MNLQTNTPAAVAVSPLLVCFVQSKLPNDDSDVVKDIVSIESYCPPWNGITTLHKDLPKDNRKAE